MFQQRTLIGLSLCIFSSLYTPTLFAQTRTQDSLALVSIYNATQGTQWTNDSGWLTDALDAWYGIKMGTTSKRVDTLRFISNNLNGTLPNDITTLTSLRSINLNGNPLLTGGIPANIDQLSQLTSLSIIDNNLSGAIPTTLGNVTTLQHLDLIGNQFTGEIPTTLSNLTALRSLQISEDGLTGTFPESLFQLTKLQNLLIESPQLSGTLPDALGNLTQLGTLGLSGTQFTGSIPASLANAAQLRFLVFSENQQLSGSIPAAVWGHPNVGFFTFISNSIGGTMPPEIGQAQLLEKLILINNLFEGAIPAELANLPLLTTIQLISNDFTDLPDLSGMAALAQLNVANNRLTFEDIEPNLALRASGKSFTYIPQKPVYDTVTLAVHAGDQLTLKTAIGGSANVYQWYKDNTAITTGTAATHTLDAVSDADASTYKATIASTVVTDLIISRNPITVTVNPTRDPIGFCSTVTLDATRTDIAAHYTWNTGATTPTLTITTPGTYTVAIETDNYILTETYTTEQDDSDLAGGEDISFDIMVAGHTIASDQPLLISGPVEFINTSTSGTTFVWSFHDDGTTSTEASPSHTYETAGTYTVTLTGQDEKGCEAHYTQEVMVQSLYITNAITANRDGDNEQLFIEPFLYPCSLKILNRWGQQVYYAPDYQNDFTGEHLTPGVYYYELNITEAHKAVTGQITLLK